MSLRLKSRFRKMAIKIMKKFAFVAVAILAVLLMVAVGNSPLENNPMDPSNGGDILGGAFLSVLLLSIAPAVSKKVAVACLLLGYAVAAIFGLWAFVVALIYSVIATTTCTEEVQNWIRSLFESK